MGNKGSGFTLVEMSIVLTIIGLLISAILASDAILKSMELKHILGKVDKYKSSVLHFQEMYGGYPGDITDATDYWSGSTNGDGDGTIDKETSNEPFAAIEQLQLAEYIDIDGTITGSWGGGFSFAVEGTSGNVEFLSGGTLIYVKCCSDSDYSRTIDFNNHVNLFTIDSNNDYRDGALTPVDAMWIDNKIDDGIPDFGFVGSSAGYNSGYSNTAECYSGSGNASSYQSASSTYRDRKGCQMQFAIDWD